MHQLFRFRFDVRLLEVVDIFWLVAGSVVWEKLPGIGIKAVEAFGIVDGISFT